MPTVDQLTAIHESGHAIAAYRLGVEVFEVTLRPRGRLMARTSVARARWHARNASAPILREAIEKDFKISLAGPIAESRVSGVVDEVAATADVANFPPQTLIHLCRETEVLVSEKWRAIERVAEALIEKRALTGQELNHLMRWRRLGEFIPAL